MIGLRDEMRDESARQRAQSALRSGSMRVSFRHLLTGLGLASALLPALAGAQETTTYTYDAKGRVTGVVRSGGPSNGTNTAYTYDAADNRTNVTVSNSPNGNGSDTGSGASVPNVLYVVVPLNGYTLIRISK